MNSALQAGPVSQSVRNALEAELALQERMEGYGNMMRSERAFGLDSFGTFPGRTFWLWGRGYWNRAESEYLDVMQTFVEMTHDPRPYERVQASGTFNPRISHPLTRLIIPAVQATHEAVTRTRAMIRCLRVLNALQTHVPAGSDEVPKLTELGLPAETTTDPYTGEPLHVKKTPQGWLVYSVGNDLKDEGGRIYEGYPFDVGVGPPPPAEEAGK
jgi:hypothetical protein